MKVVHDFPHGVRVIENVMIPMSDGCQLAARIWMPVGAEERPLPAVLEYMPYRKRDFTRPRDEPLHHYFAGHGYVSLRIDLRGSGDSDGLLLDEYLPREQLDAIEAIAWIAAQPWCDGNVGMIGISWGGFNGLQVAARRPPALKAIITLCSTDDRYTDDAHYAGGCLLTQNLDWGAVFMVTTNCPPDPEIVGSGWRQMWRERLENAVLYPEIWMRHPHRDDYWKQGSVCEDFGAIECAVYAVGGWADGYVNAIPRLMEGLTAPRKGLIGPWAHAFPHHALPGPSIGFFQESLRWWDYWLKGIDTGVMDEPMLRAWMQEYLRPAPIHPIRPGRWVAEEQWPSPRIDSWRHYINVLTLGTRPEPEDKMRICSPQTTGLAAGDWYAFGGAGESPSDQREDDGKSLVFDSDPLAERVEILGAPVLSLELEVDQPVAMIAARLNDVAPDGTSSRVSFGLLNLTQRDSRESPSPVVPGQRYRVELELKHAGYSFAPGHTIRIALSTSYWPVAWPAPEPVKLTLYTGVSYVDLPVRPPSDADADLRPFEEPERGPRPELTLLESLHARRSVERDFTTNETTYRVASDGGDFGGATLARIEDIDLTVGYMISKLYRIREYDPSDAKVTIEQTATHARQGWSTRLECRTELTASPEEFRLRASLMAFVDDLPFVVRAWDERIPRKLV